MRTRINKAVLTLELIKREWTQKQLAENAGISANTVSFIMCGKSILATTAHKIAKALNLPIEQLLEQKEERP